MKDHYKILGIPFDATSAQIKKAYYQLAQKYHPDKNGGSKIFEEKFKEINEAYEVLSNPNEKFHYDELYRYVILKQQNTSKQYHQEYQQQTKQQNTTSKLEKEKDYSDFIRVIPFLLFALFRYCSDSESNNLKINYESLKVKKEYQDSMGKIINGTLEQYITDKNNNNAFEVQRNDSEKIHYMLDDNR
ncbi:MAG: DnaJ domain-containing protein [Chitinophagales bacterium]